MNYHVLFTGGLDSTYRLCQLALDKEAVIQPVYLLFPDDGTSRHIRPELSQEINAQDYILDFLHKSSLTKATFLPILRVHRDDIPSGQRSTLMYLSNIRDYDLRFAWETQLAFGKLGWQYYYIGMYSHWDKDVELCQEQFPRPFYKNNVTFVTDALGRKKVLVDDTLGRSFAFFDFIFRDVTLPILGVSRDRMISDLSSLGFSDLLYHIWFCYRSVHGKPCGVCDNCLLKLKQGLEFLFDAEAVHRYYIYQILALLNNDVALCYQTYIVFGETAFYDKVFERQFLGNPFLFDKYVLDVTLFKRLFSLETSFLKKLLINTVQPHTVYDIIMLHKKRR